MTSPSIVGVLETALYVEDLDTAQEFYERVLGFVQVFREDGRLHALRVPSGQILLLFKIGRSVRPTLAPGGLIPPHDGRGVLHVAFEIESGQIDAWRVRLGELGVGIESEVECPKSGHSIYFRDPDEHSVELVTRDCWNL